VLSCRHNQMENVLVSAPHARHAAPEQPAWHGVRNQAEATEQDHLEADLGYLQI